MIYWVLLQSMIFAGLDDSKFIHSHYKHLLSAYCILNTVHWDAVVSKSISDLASLPTTLRIFVGS